MHARRPCPRDPVGRFAHRCRVRGRTDRRPVWKHQWCRRRIGVRQPGLRRRRRRIRASGCRDHRQPSVLPRVPDRHHAGPCRFRRRRRLDRRPARHRIRNHPPDHRSRRAADRPHGGRCDLAFGAADRWLFVPDRRRRHIARGSRSRERRDATAERPRQLCIGRHHRRNRGHVPRRPVPRALRRAMLRSFRRRFVPARRGSPGHERIDVCQSAQPRRGGQPARRDDPRRHRDRRRLQRERHHGDGRHHHGRLGRARRRGGWGEARYRHHAAEGGRLPKGRGPCHDRDHARRDDRRAGDRGRRRGPSAAGGAARPACGGWPEGGADRAPQARGRARCVAAAPEVA